MNLSNELAKINKGLATEGIKLRVEQRKELLNLRGPLPSPTTKGILKNQRISLHLHADSKGLEEAQKMLELVLLQLKHDQFNWDHWSNKRLPTKPIAGRHAIEEAIASFKSDFFSNPNRKQSKHGSITTWSSAYLPYLKRLISFDLKSNGKMDIDLLN